MKKYLNFLILILLLAFTSCGAKTSNVAVKLQGSFSQVAGLFENGAVMIAVGGPSDKPPLLYTVPLNSASFDHTFDNGIWKIMILGWDGAPVAGEMMEGNLYCSVNKNVSFPDQDKLEFSLSRVDVNTDLVVDSGHPCEEFIDGLQTVKYASICETQSCNAGEYLNYNNTSLSLKFGIPFYEGPINKQSILSQARFTNEMNTCYSSTIGNLLDGSNYAKLEIDSTTGITLPLRLTGGFYLPIRFEGYEDPTMNCTAGFNNSVTTINSIGELDATGAQTKHWNDGTSFIYRMPPTPFELTNAPLSNTMIERNNVHSINIDGPYSSGNDTYQGFGLTYNCQYKNAGDDDSNLIPCTDSSYLAGASLTFSASNGTLYFDGTVNLYTFNQNLEFVIDASYTDGTTYTTPEVRFSTTFDIANQITSAIDVSGVSFLNSGASSNNLSIYNNSDIDRTFYINSGAGIVISNGAGCPNQSLCNVEVTGSNIMVDGDFEIYDVFGFTMIYPYTSTP
ncbi:hypothetical protein [Halobacteriovorax sp. DPLXC-1]|uniref:hypothetical protein n=1 Tax=Halobacteriovorax sp. DPLXC-1 TaxID=3110771 RepID=UPI002FEFF7C7